MASPQLRAEFRRRLAAFVGPYASQLGEVQLIQPRPGSILALASLQLPVGPAGVEMARAQLEKELGTRVQLEMWAGRTALVAELPAERGAPRARCVWIFPPRQGSAYLVVASSEKGAAVRDALLARVRTLVAYRPHAAPVPVQHSLGGIKPGMSQGEVEALLGPADEWFALPDGSGVRGYARLQLVLLFAADTTLAAIETLGPAAPPLDDGLRAGSSRAELLRRYGADCIVLPQNPATGSAPRPDVASHEVAWCVRQQLMLQLAAGRITQLVLHRNADEAFVLEQRVQRALTHVQEVR